jgi:transposase-like protein
MERSDFEAWLSAVESLTAAQRRLAFRELALAEAADGWQDGAEDSDTGFGAADDGGGRRSEGQATTSAQAATRERATFADIAKVRLARDGCPHCGCREVRPWGGARGLRRCRCAQCRKTFNPFTARPVAGLHNKQRWLDQGRALVDGESLAKAAARRQIHPSTTFRRRH